MHEKTFGGVRMAFSHAKRKVYLTHSAILMAAEEPE